MEIRIMIIGFLSMFVVGVSDLIVVGLISPMSSHFHAKEALIGQLVTLYAIAFAVLGPILTKATNHFRDKSVLCTSFVIFMLCNFVTTLISSFVLVCIIRILLAGSASLITVKLLALGSKLVAERNKARVVANIYVGFSAANVLGIPIGTMLGNYVDWKIPFYLISLISLISMGLMQFYISEPSEKQQMQPTNGKSYVILDKKVIILTLSILVLMMISNSVLFTYMEPIMKTNGMSVRDVGIALFLAGIFGILGSKLGNILSEKWGYRLSFIVICITYISSIITLMAELNNLLVVFISISVWNLFHWGTNPTVQYALLNSIKGDPSQIFSYNISLLNLGIGIGSLMGGVLFSIDQSFYSSFVFSILLGFFSLLLVVLGLNRKQIHQYERKSL